MHTSMREARQLGVFGLWGETLPTAWTFTGRVVGVTKKSWTEQTDVGRGNIVFWFE